MLETSEYYKSIFFYASCPLYLQYIGSNFFCQSKFIIFMSLIGHKKNKLTQISYNQPRVTTDKKTKKKHEKNDYKVNKNKCSVTKKVVSCIYFKKSLHK